MYGEAFCLGPSRLKLVIIELRPYIIEPWCTRSSLRECFTLYIIVWFGFFPFQFDVKTDMLMAK